MSCLKERKRRTLSDPWLWCTQVHSTTYKPFLSLLEQALERKRWAAIPLDFRAALLSPRHEINSREGEKEMRFVLPGTLSEFPFKVPVTATTGESLSVCSAPVHFHLHWNWANKPPYVYIKQRRNMLRKQFYFQAWMEVLQLTERKKTNIKSRH